MPSRPISAEAAEKRIAAVEQKLTEGYTPPSVTPPAGMSGAIRAAAVADGSSSGASQAWLRAAIRVTGRNPDWSLYRAKPVTQPEITVPDGFRLKGTSTLVDMQTGEPKLEWVKTEADKERQKQMMLEWIADLNRQIKPAPPVSKPKHSDDDLLACYPISDFHVGMLAWSDETLGGDFDLQIAESLLKGAVDYLVSATPASGNALIVILGDFYHYDGPVPETPRGKNDLDADGRAGKMHRVGIQLIRYTIERVLKKHANVHIIAAPGNHDPTSIGWTRLFLSELYANEPRVTVDASPAHFHYYKFGKNMVGVHHGHTVKMQELPSVMATDRPRDWGETEHRCWWVGHKHSKERLKDSDFRGCEVEQFRVMIPNDNWAASHGYRHIQSMHAIVRHREHGEVSRLTVNPKMLK